MSAEERSMQSWIGEGFDLKMGGKPVGPFCVCMYVCESECECVCGAQPGSWKSSLGPARSSPCWTLRSVKRHSLGGPLAITPSSAAARAPSWVTRAFTT